MLNKILNVDFHIHSIKSKYKEAKGYVDNSNINNINILLKNLNKNNINMFAISDHNRYDYYLYRKIEEVINSDKLSEHKLYPNVLKIFPAIEFDVQLEGNFPPCHIICIFDDRKPNELKHLEERIFNIKKLEKPEDYYTKDEFERIIKSIGLDVILIAHQNRQIYNPKDEKNTERIISNACNNVKLYLETGYINALEFKNPKHENHIQFSLSEANSRTMTLRGSDCHVWEHYPKKDEKSIDYDYISKFKCQPTFKGLIFAFTSIETRVNRSENNNIGYIESININGVNIPIDKSINAIIGDNGSGKTFVLKSINNLDIKGEYSDFKKVNKVVTNTINESSIIRIEQNEIISILKNGKLFEKLNLNIGDIQNIDVFKSNIIKYAYDLNGYITSNIEKGNNSNELSKRVIKIKSVNQPQLPLINCTDLSTKNVQDYIDRQNIFINFRRQLINDYDANKQIYNSLNIDIDILLSILEDTIDKFQNEIDLINCQNNIINNIISKLKELDIEIGEIKGTAEKEISNYNKEKDEFIHLVNTEICNHYINKSYPQFPSPLSGIISVPHGGYVFIKKAAFNDKNLETNFYSELFNSDYASKEKIKEIKDITEYKNALKKSDNFNDWLDKKVSQFITKYTMCDEYIKEADDSGADVSTPGEIATVFYKYKFDTIKGCKTIIIDQPEDDICSATIYNKLIRYFNQKRDQVQIIFSTHNPMLVVNLDVDNVIVLEKKNNTIKAISGCLEYEYKNEYSILSFVEKILDGSKTAIERRLKIYND